MERHLRDLWSHSWLEYLLISSLGGSSAEPWELMKVKGSQAIHTPKYKYVLVRFHSFIYSFIHSICIYLPNKSHITRTFSATESAKEELALLFLLLSVLHQLNSM